MYSIKHPIGSLKLSSYHLLLFLLHTEKSDFFICINGKLYYLNINDVDDRAAFLDVLGLFRSSILEIVFPGEIVDIDGKERQIFGGFLNFSGGIQHHGDLRSCSFEDDLEDTGLTTPSEYNLDLRGREDAVLW